ncbi:hypothetical protein C0Q70_00047 [Pomacea canaliculata]|uniref:Uncharacterized protein n=1 Tax=Pomacea canaliculata TaxID=400727 RepID=A0A2T7PVP6_POMCA|nr:hypothetical protein C0Q70_00047 [Pomacea canaliculata]
MAGRCAGRQVALTARAAGSRLQLEALPADGGRGLTVSILRTRLLFARILRLPHHLLSQDPLSPGLSDGTCEQGTCMPLVPCNTSTPCSLGHVCDFHFNLGYHTCQYNLDMATPCAWTGRVAPSSSP